MLNLIPNYISLARILLVFTLVFVRPLSLEFFIIYLVCGISDMIDGYLARKMNTESKLGEKLDSLADFIMVSVVIIILYPIIDINVKIFYWIIGIVLIRLISIIIVYIKYKTFGIIHTLGNKITGLMLFVFPFIIKSEVFIYLLCILGSLSTIEELIIHLFSTKYDANKKSLLYNVNRSV
ncbi:MAG: CDP-alcohol phosphatidyltransferase family protein [bacterium]